MAKIVSGLEYRGRRGSSNQLAPAKDMEVDKAVYDVLKANQPVKLVAGKPVAIANGETPYGVVAAREIAREVEDHYYVKVREGENLFYETLVTGGTAVVGTRYNLKANGDLDASAVAATGAAIVDQVLPAFEGKVTAYVRILQK